ncbi:MAG: hypothetical protein J5910_06990 [Lachnospiraceae bacterium]|nr:hypothetical protein [Lachnospiraceae bacterium]
MERKYYKAINFDLDTRELAQYYKPYNKAYYEVKRFFKQHGFSHRQGSGYVSDNKLSTVEVMVIVDEFVHTFPWTGTCVEKIDVTNIGAQYDLKPFMTASEEEFDW